MLLEIELLPDELYLMCRSKINSQDFTETPLMFWPHALQSNWSSCVSNLGHLGVPYEILPWAKKFLNPPLQMRAMLMSRERSV